MFKELLKYSKIRVNSDQFKGLFIWIYLKNEISLIWRIVKELAINHF